jgi:hypothetical protein
MFILTHHCNLKRNSILLHMCILFELTVFSVDLSGQSSFYSDDLYFIRINVFLWSTVFFWLIILWQVSDCNLKRNSIYYICVYILRSVCFLWICPDNLLFLFFLFFSMEENYITEKTVFLTHHCNLKSIVFYYICVYILRSVCFLWICPDNLLFILMICILYGRKLYYREMFILWSMVIFWLINLWQVSDCNLKSIVFYYICVYILNSLSFLFVRQSSSFSFFLYFSMEENYITEKCFIFEVRWFSD